MSDWSNLPEGVVTLVASRYDGPRSEVIRALRGVCKPWCAEVTAGATKCTLNLRWTRSAELFRVLSKTIGIRELTFKQKAYYRDYSILTNIAKYPIPALKSVTFDECGLCDSDDLPLSESLPGDMLELRLLECEFGLYSFRNFHNFSHLTSLTVHLRRHSYDFNFRLCVQVMTMMPSLQVIKLDTCRLWARDWDNRVPHMPNLTRLEMTNSVTNYTGFLNDLPRLEHLNLEGTFIDHENDEWATVFPVTITTLNIRETKTKISVETFARMADRLAMLSSLKIGWHHSLTDETLAVIARMPLLTKLSLELCFRVTDAGLISLARSSKLEWVEIQRCKQVTKQGVDALHAAAPGLEIVFEV